MERCPGPVTLGGVQGNTQPCDVRNFFELRASSPRYRTKKITCGLSANWRISHENTIFEYLSSILGKRSTSRFVTTSRERGRREMLQPVIRLRQKLSC